MIPIDRRHLMAGAVLLAGSLFALPGQAHDGGPYGRPNPVHPGYAGPGWQSAPPAPWMQGGPVGPGPFAWQGPRSCNGETRADMLARRLDLDRKQRRAIEDLLDEAYDDFRDIGEEMHDNRRRLGREMRRKDADQSLIDRLAKKQGELLTRMIERRARLNKDILAELDDEQKERYAHLRTAPGAGYCW